MTPGSGRSSAQVVLRHLLRNGGPVTRPQVAHACGLSRPTVSQAVRVLEQRRLLTVVGERTGRPGRSAALYDLDASAGCVAGIDIGGTNLRVRVSDPAGRLLAEDRTATSRRGGQAVVKQAVALLRPLLHALTPARPLLALGVSTPGAVDPAGILRYASNIGVTETLDLKTPLQRAFDAPLLLENNVNMAALGELHYGAGRRLRTFAVVAVGAGVGAGLIHEGRLVRGAHGAAGEVSFLPLEGIHREPRPPRIEEEAGAVGILHAARRQRGWHGEPPASVEDLFVRAERGEPPAVAVLEEEIRRIGAIVTSVAVMFDPERIILGGGIGTNPALTERVRRHAAALAPFPPDVEVSELGDQASLLGAVAVALDVARDRLLTQAGDNQINDAPPRPTPDRDPQA